MEKLNAVADSDLPKVMAEVAKEINTIFKSPPSKSQANAFVTFCNTLLTTGLKLINYLPPQEQQEIIILCGTFLDIGVLFGKSPQLLADIITRVNPEITLSDAPDWLVDFIKTGLSKLED
jgi:hypothetical protein